MIQVIISPAKQMDTVRGSFAATGIPPFPRHTERILDALRCLLEKQGPRALQDLWTVSDALLDENVQRLRAFRHAADAGDLDTPELARRTGAALFSYIGLQYRSMAPEVLGEDALFWLQGHLWILSALYGCVRPFDAVQPYRLEMGAKLSVDGARSLYAFWGDALARQICAGGGIEVVNLASTEYSKAVLPRLDPDTPVATCIFSSSLRNGKPAQKSTESKTARGSMVRWMAETQAGSLEDLKGFDVGFRFEPELSNEDGARQTLVFMKR